MATAPQEPRCRWCGAGAYANLHADTGLCQGCMHHYRFYVKIGGKEPPNPYAGWCRKCCSNPCTGDHTRASLGRPRDGDKLANPVLRQGAQQCRLCPPDGPYNVAQRQLTIDQF